ncbi:Catalase [Ceraceosorus bombacis]|uniref:Catalase n=1 Tax=Ceraceosorus bombacis TaxID=401625 RepID=A0A0P1BDP9_9BASI|nr:Catalase [Ceraceosorus bombacis]
MSAIDRVAEAARSAADGIVGQSGANSQANSNGRATNAKLEQLKQFVDYPKDGENIATTEHGLPVANNTAWLKGGARGPMLLEDQVAREKVHQFDHERIPERVVHARGAAAHGTFKITKPLGRNVTAANVLNDTSKETPVFLRFSTVQGPRGSADTVRDVRGFAVKFYTDEGNWDIVGNDIPIFFVADSHRFIDLVHAVKPEPQLEVPTGQSAHPTFWDWVSLSPESAHMNMWQMSPYGIPRYYHTMRGHGVNTYRLVGEDGSSRYVKFHFFPEVGCQSLNWDEALKIQGQNPDFHRTVLAEMIDAGKFPRWKFAVQIMEEDDEDIHSWDPLDSTKVWPAAKYPFIEVGELELNANPTNYFAETENVAFCTSHVVPGIDFSDDPLLQGRNFSYSDTQLSRLGGPNWHQIPINRPVCPLATFNRDGAMPMKIPKGANYFPNSEGNATNFAPTFNKADTVTKPEALPGQIWHDSAKQLAPGESRQGFSSYPEDLARLNRLKALKLRTNGPKFANYFEQAQIFWNSVQDHERASIKEGAIFELSKVPDEGVRKRIVHLYRHINPDLAKAVADEFRLNVPTDAAIPISQETYPELSLHYENIHTIRQKRIAIIKLDGTPESEIETIKKRFESGDALVFIIDHRGLDAMRSTLFDATFLPLTNEQSYRVARSHGRVKHWIRESTGHLKPLLINGSYGLSLVKQVITNEAEGIEAAVGDDIVSSFGVVTSAADAASSQKLVDAFVEAVAHGRHYARPGVASLAF